MQHDFFSVGGFKGGKRTHPFAANVTDIDGRSCRHVKLPGQPQRPKSAPAPAPPRLQCAPLSRPPPPLLPLAGRLERPPKNTGTRSWGRRGGGGGGGGGEHNCRRRDKQ